MITLILLLKSLEPHTGNNSTIQRLQGYFRVPKYRSLMVGANAYHNSQDFHDFLLEQRVNLVIGIHAFHAGRLLVNSPVPYVIIFGGTDLNEFSNHVEKLTTMTKAVESAQTLVTFNAALEKKSQVIWNELSSQKLTFIPQAVVTNPSNFRIRKYLRDHNLLPSYCSEKLDELCLITLIGGIRPVKDQLFLTSTFANWHRSHPDMLLVIIGPIIDEGYSKQMKSKIKNLQGVIFIPGLHHSDIHATITDSFTVINSSVSEGMPTTLLEAMDLGTLVIVRDNPGNCSLVKHKETGLVYETPTDFIACLHHAFHNVSHRKLMIENAKRLVTTKHGCEYERRQYHRIVETFAAQS